MTQPLFLKPAFHEKPWGGISLRGQFHYDIPSDQTGECWAVSGHPDGPSIVRNGFFSGKTLTELWEDHPELFGDLKQSEFPLLIKLIDNEIDLPVQVYGGDQQSAVNAAACLYVIDCKKGAEMILGHTAETREELEEMMKQNHQNKLRRVPIQPGDFFLVSSGSVHALGSGTFALEIRASDAKAYPLFGSNQQQNAAAFVSMPHQETPAKEKTEHRSGSFIETLVEAASFSVYKYDISAATEFVQDKPFLSFSVIDGAGALLIGEDTFPLQKGDHFILPSGLDKFTLNGSMSLIVAHP